MARTTSKAVQTILGYNYKPDDGHSLTPYIRIATRLIDRVVTCAATKDVTFTDAELEEMETWLAAHWYTQMDPLYKSRSTAGGSGSFQDHNYLNAALALDTSGCLDLIINPSDAGRKVVGATWLGKAPSEQTLYRDRD